LHFLDLKANISEKSSLVSSSSLLLNAYEQRDKVISAETEVSATASHGTLTHECSLTLGVVENANRGLSPGFPSAV